MNWDDIQNWENEKLNDPNIIRGFVVGVTFVEGYPGNLIRLLAVIKETGTIRAYIRRNPDNPYDRNACEVWIDDSMIGHLDRDTAAEIAPKLDSGAEPEIFIASIGFANGDTSKPGASYLLRV